MSVNITVNGKFTRHPLLHDAEMTKKQLECERRKLRLQQVRAQSNEMARKIRDDVSKETKRQLRNLDAIKEQELNCWREQVLTKKRHDYRTAIFQVGKAHNAARAENEANKAAKAAITSDDNNAKCGTKRRPPLRKKFTSPSAQKSTAKNTCSEPPRTAPNVMKRKRVQVCFDNEPDECCGSVYSETGSTENSDTDESMDTSELCRSLSATSVSDCRIEESNTSQRQRERPNAMQESERTPTVPLNIDEENAYDSRDDVIAPAQVINHHIESNRKFQTVISTGPHKILTTISTQTRNTIPPERFDEKSSTSSLIVSELVPKPRYTQISDLLAKQQRAQGEILEKTVQVPTPDKQHIGENSVTTVYSKPSEPANPKSPKKPKSPRKSKSPSTSKSPPSKRKSASSQSKTSKIYNVPSCPNPSVANENGSTGSSALVQYYDYANKFAKEYASPADVIAVHSTDTGAPNAMQEAEIEKELQKARELEIQKHRQRSDERGKIALEREQVRRDCIELTEKLEALERQRPHLLPSDSNLYGPHYFAEQAARKELKMSTAIEEILLRPSIITCDDVKRAPERPKKTYIISPNEIDEYDLNLGAARKSCEKLNLEASKSLDSDSCASILLGYVDDQRNQIRNELNQCESSEPNLDKKQKLMKLMERIENLRDTLRTELSSDKVTKRNTEEQKQGGEATKEITKAEQKHGDDVKERSSKVSQSLKEQRKEITKADLPIEARERDLLQREQLLEQKLSELNATNGLEIGMKKKSSEQHTYKEQHINTAGEPLEIVIKVKRDKKCSKRKLKIGSPQLDTAADPISAKTKPSTSKAANSDRKNSYDSNSTAYRSMPDGLTNATKQFVERMKHMEKHEKHSTNVSESSPYTETTTSASTRARIFVENSHCQARTHLNPLIAQYVQRLLGMSRKSLKALEISSSDIDTPSSSVINVAANIAAGEESGEQSLLSEDHVQRVERFINENRSFINELEESVRTHSNTSVENSMRQFEEIWQQKLSQTKANAEAKNREKTNKVSILKTRQSKTVKIQKKSGENGASPKTKQSPTRQIEAVRKRVQMQAPTMAIRKTTERRSTVTTAKIDAKSVDLNTAQFQLQHYAELTKNCSNRIAELTALITKVREEKQRLLEATLTSVSDNGRNSTEYCELPPEERRRQATRNERNGVTSSPDSTQSKLLDSNRLPEIPRSPVEAAQVDTEETAAAPLEKHKTIGRSRDSGISMPSRPLTAQGAEIELEPQSFASTNTTTHSSTHTQRKIRPPPPPALQRYSPQLAEDDIHELSTIVEVDTPATSRLNTSATTTTQARNPTNSVQPRRLEQAQRFPTFEEYVRELHVDLSVLDAEQSDRMQYEYNELIDAIKDGQGAKLLNYAEFPTLTAYLQDVTTLDETCHTPETIEDLFACLRLAPLAAQPFPTHKQYRQREVRHTTPEFEGYIDSESLENLSVVATPTQTGTDTDSETLNIEEELKKRNILKHSFRSSSTRQEKISTPTTTYNHEERFETQSVAIEPGVERLANSTNDSASEKFQRELLALGLQWPKTMRNKEKEAAALISSSSSAETNCPATQEIKPTQKPQVAEKRRNIPHCDSGRSTDSDVSSGDRPVDLREFLTRQLMKHVTATSSCSSTMSECESVRSQFFLAVLGSMSQPNGTPHTPQMPYTPHTQATSGSLSAALNAALERQKTSTPVQGHSTQSISTSQSISNSSTNNNNQSLVQLFSGESHLSSVHYHEESNSANRSRIPVKSKDNKRKGRDH